MRIRVRLFAIHRQIVGRRELALELPDGAPIEAAWDDIAGRWPSLAPGRPSLRFARNGEYVDPATPLADGDELAIIPPVSGGSGEAGGTDEGGGTDEAGATDHDEPPNRILELRETPFGNEILAELADRLATDLDGAVVGFLGRTRRSPGTPAPGQEAEAARHAGRAVESLGYEAHETMAIRILDDIAGEIAERFGVRRIAIVHRSGDVPLGQPSIAVVAVAEHRDAAFRAARYGIDETKARAPIWKAERFADGELWIGEPARTTAPEPTPAASPAPRAPEPGATDTEGR